MKKIKAVVCLFLTITMAAVGVLGLTANAFAAPRQEVNFALTDEPSTKTVTMSVTVDNAQYTDVYALYFDFDPDILTFDSVVFGNEIVNALRSEGFDESSLNAFVKNNNTLAIAFFYLLNTASKNTNVCTVKFRYNELNRQTKITLLPSSEVASNGGGFKFESISEYVGVSFKRGDVDGDGDVTVADARLALRAAVKLEALTGSALLAADADGSDGVTVADARSILRVAVGLDSFDKESPVEILKAYVKEHGEKDEDCYRFYVFDGNKWYNGNKLADPPDGALYVALVYDLEADTISVSQTTFSKEPSGIDDIVRFDLEDNGKETDVAFASYSRATSEREEFLLAKIYNNTYTENTKIDFYYDMYGAQNYPKLYESIKTLTKQGVEISLKCLCIFLKEVGLNISDFGYKSY